MLRPSTSWSVKIMFPCLNFLQSSGSNPYASPAREKKSFLVNVSLMLLPSFSGVNGGLG